MNIKAQQEAIKQLKRDKQYDQALALLTAYIEHTEAQNRTTPHKLDYWPYHQTAIIHRQLKNYPDEIAAVHRYSQHGLASSVSAQKFLQRLPRAHQLAQTPPDQPRHASLIKHALVVDTETTGLDQTDQLIEFGAVLISFDHLTGRLINQEDTYSGLRQPTIPIPAGATKKHGITNNDVRGQHLNDSKINQLAHRADLIIAHNASFDRRYILPLYPTYGGKLWLCSMNGIPWKRNGHASKGLEKLMRDYKLSHNNAHRALNDVHAVIQLLQQPDPHKTYPLLLTLLTSRPVEKRQRNYVPSKPAYIPSTTNTKKNLTLDDLHPPKPRYHDLGLALAIFGFLLLITVGFILGSAVGAITGVLILLTGLFLRTY